MAACKECWDGGDLKKLILCHLQQMGAAYCSLWTLEGFIDKFKHHAQDFVEDVRRWWPHRDVDAAEAIGIAIEHADWAGLLEWFHHYGGSHALTGLGYEAAMALHPLDAYIGKRESRLLPPEQQEAMFQSFEARMRRFT